MRMPIVSLSLSPGLAKFNSRCFKIFLVVNLLSMWILVPRKRWLPVAWEVSDIDYSSQVSKANALAMKTWEVSLFASTARRRRRK